MLVPSHPSPLAEHYRRTGLWPGETLWTAFSRTAAAFPGKPALVEDDVPTTFGALAGQAERLAGGIAHLGVGTSDIIAFQLPNWREAVVVLLAAARLGAVATPILPIHRRRELGFILARSGARLLFVPGRWRGFDHRTLVAELRDELPTLEHVVVVRDEPLADERSYASVAAATPPSAPAPADGGAVALLIHTSGTSADPKGVLHSHDTLLAEARSLGPVHAFTPADVVLMPSPLTHIAGIVHALLVPAVLGTTAVLMDRWDPGVALARIAAARVTYMVGAPIFLRELAEHPERARYDTRSFRLFSCGGADVDPALVRDAARSLGCVAKRVYGSTEFPTVTTTAPDDPPERRIDSEGRAIGAAEVRVVDDDGSPLPPGREGEVWARGPECFLGYGNAALDAEAFAADGWFRTGDLGTLDAGGWLRITGRRKDIIIRKGENISARELEELLADHPAVAEVAVIGVPDAAAGEIACVVLRPRPGVGVPTLAEVVEHLGAAGLSRRKLPERLEVVAEFPRTESGKILKRALRDRLAPRRARPGG